MVAVLIKIKHTKNESKIAKKLSQIFLTAKITPPINTYAEPIILYLYKKYNTYKQKLAIL